MKIAILGAGAMGCLFGAHLSKAHEVTLFDVSEKQIDAIHQNGVQIEANGETTVYRNLRAAKNGTAIGAVDSPICMTTSFSGAACTRSTRSTPTARFWAATRSF